jgi:hypothetical protein
VGYA